jgi:peroxiredoxin
MIRIAILFAKERTVLRVGTLLNRALPLILAAIPIYAASPTTGEKAPDFQLSTVDGKAVRLSDLTPKGPVVLVVLRGYPGYQCPYCNRQVQDFLQKAPALAAGGAHVVMVYPGPPQDLGSRATEFLTGKTLPENVDLLLDPGYEFTNRYGLRWDAPSETAYPATFILDRNGIIFFTKIVKAHGGRATAQEILDVLPKPKPAR